MEIDSIESSGGEGQDCEEAQPGKRPRRLKETVGVREQQRRRAAIRAKVNLILCHSIST